MIISCLVSLSHLGQRLQWKKKNSLIRSLRSYLFSPTSLELQHTAYNHASPRLGRESSHTRIDMILLIPLR